MAIDLTMTKLSIKANCQVLLLLVLSMEIIKLRLLFICKAEILDVVGMPQCVVLKRLKNRQSKLLEKLQNKMVKCIILEKNVLIVAILKDMFAINRVQIVLLNQDKNQMQKIIV